MKKLFLLASAIFMFSCSSDDAGKSTQEEPCTDIVWGLQKHCPTANEINCIYYVNHVSPEGSYETKVSKEVYYFYEVRFMDDSENQEIVCWEGENPI